MSNLTDRCIDLINQINLSNKKERHKRAFTPPSGGMDPNAAAGGGGGAPPMDPSMGGGAPPMDPSMMGGDPSMGGGAPPMDPSMMGGGGMPPMDPSMMGGGGMPPMDPSMMAAMMGGAPAGADSGSGKKTKLDPEIIYNRLTKIIKLLIFLCNALGADKIPADLLLDEGESMPSGSMQAAMPSVAPMGGPSDGTENVPTAAGPETKEGSYRIGTAVNDPWGSSNSQTLSRNASLAERAESLKYFMARESFN